MENPKSDEQETKRAIEKVKQFTNDQNVLAGVQALLNIIPYAGSTLSLILSEYRSRRYSKRILATLVELREDIGRLEEEKRNILSQDEVIEVIHDTLAEIAKTSSEEKLRYLRNSLTKAFTKDDIDYSQKQFYLSKLTELSLGELELLRVIYLSPDPFEQIVPKRVSSTVDSNAILSVGQLNVVRLPPQYDIEYKEPTTGETLQEVLQKRLEHLSKGTLEGLIDALDARGLSRIRANLNERTVKILTETYPDANQLVPHLRQVDVVSFQMATGKPGATPIEASRTQFGEDFIRYIQYKY